MKIGLLALFLFSFNVLADGRSQREALDNVYKLDQFRIFYTLNGEHALPVERQMDLNQNNIPDYIEHIATQLKIADLIYSKVFGLKPPLQKDRYRGQVAYIDIHILKTHKTKSVTGDKIVRYHYQNSLTNREKSLVITLANQTRIDSLTPEHELFHVYQNGYAMYKNKWYKEGLANWSESAFSAGVGPNKPLPQTDEQLEELLGRSYDAKFFWNRLTLLCDTHEGVFSVPDEINRLDSNYVIQDLTLNGYAFIRHFLENLESSSLRQAQAMDYARFDWGKNQTAEDNNPYILAALKKALLEHCHAADSNIEIQTLLALIEENIP